MCNCRKKVMNNLDIPSYIRQAKEVWSKVSSLNFDDITEDLWLELYHTYSSIYPNSKGTPNKNELLEIIQKAASYKN